MLLALTLWAFTHGIIQIAMAKGTDLARRGVAIHDFSNYAFQLIRAVAETPSVPKAVDLFLARIFTHV